MKNFVLATLDLDYTTFLGNSVLYLNKALVISEKLDKYHADYSNGKISEKELNILQAPLLQKISISKACEVLTKGPILKGLKNGVELLKNAGCDVQMLTFNPFQLFFKKYYGIGNDVSSLWKVKGDSLGDVSDFPENKVALLREYCSEKGIDLMQCVHVGDSQNDAQTFREVGFSIALNSYNITVAREASVSLNTDDFRDVANTILRAMI